jgi:membrane-associated phospholipid phosphatase
VCAGGNTVIVVFVSLAVHDRSWMQGLPSLAMQRARSVAIYAMTGSALALPGVVAVAVTDQMALHAMLNHIHTAWADDFFRFITHGADGLVPTALAIALLIVKDLRSFLMMGLGCGLSALVTQFLKRQVFPELHRPGMYRDQLGDMQWVADLDLNHHFTFPSGHATAAFSMCMALVVIAGRPRWAAPLALIAGLLAYSRVYLSQHFMEDILAGGFIGAIVSGGVYYWLYQSSYAHKVWLHRTVGRSQK